MKRIAAVASRACVAAIVALAATALAGNAVIQVGVGQRGDTFVIDASLSVDVPIEVAWDVLTDFDGMHGFVPNLHASRIVRTDGPVVTIEQRGSLRFGFIEQAFETERRIELARPNRMRTTQIAGSMRRLDSTTTFTPRDGGTRLDYRVEIEPGSFMPDFITRWFLDYEFRMQLAAIAQEMERRHARSGGTPGR
jgi:carbon monoxide dehydrogenase subunit G